MQSTALAIGLLVASLVFVVPADATCTLTDGGLVSLKPGTSGSQPVPGHAVPAPPQGFYFLYTTSVDFVNASSEVKRVIASQSAPPGGNVAIHAFTNIHAGTFVGSASALVLLDAADVLLINISGTSSVVTQLLTLSNLQYEIGVSLTHNESHVFIAGKSCVGAVDIRRAGGWTYDPVVGTCGTQSSRTLSPASPSTSLIGAVTGIAWDSGATALGLGIWTTVQMIGFNVSSGTLDPFTSTAPAWATSLSSMGPVPAHGIGTFPDGACDMLVDRGEGISLAHSRVGFTSPLCLSTSKVIGFIADSLTGNILTVVVTNTTVRFVNYESCTFTAYSISFWANLPQATTTPPPSTDASATASGSTDTTDTTTIAIAIAVGLVVLVGIIAAVLIVTGTRKPPASDTAPAPNEPISETARSVDTVAQRPTSDGESASTPLHAAASSPGKTGRVAVAGRRASRASASDEKRLLNRSAQGGVRVSALSRGDFDRSMQDTDEGLKRKLGLRAWSDAELRRHNRRCAFVRESQYQRGKLLGRGANGSVYAVLLHDGSTIAMKEVRLMGDEDEIAGQMAEVENEMGLLSALHHDNLVTYYGVVCDESRMEVALFMENVTGGSLAALVRGMDATLPESMAQLFTKQMLRGLAYIHQAGIVHRDLKCDNVLRDAHTGTVKLADFGTAKRLGNAAGASRAAQTMIGTPYFMAPEILEAAAEEGEGYGSKADIWSIGILVGELLNRGNAPWPAFPSPAHAFMHILNKDNAPELPAGLSEHCEDFIRQCTRRDPRERPSAVELLEHPWILLAADVADDDLAGSIGGSTDPFEVSRSSHPTAAAKAAPS